MSGQLGPPLHHEIVEHRGSAEAEVVRVQPLRPGHLVHTERFDNIDSPYSVIDTTYTESDGKTHMRAVITYDSPETVQAVLDSGMESGMQASYDAVDDVLADLGQR